MLRLEYLPALGALQVMIDGHRSVLKPGSDAGALPPFVQAVFAALSLVEDSEIAEIQFDDESCAVRASGRVLGPGAEGEEPDELVDFHNAIYSYDDGHYADRYAQLRAPAPPGEPVPETPEQIHARQVWLVERTFENEIASITTGYTPSEILTWDQQKVEATAWNTNPLAATPFIDAMVSESGRDKEDLVAAILVKAQAFAVAVGAALGRKQAAIAALDAE